MSGILGWEFYQGPEVPPPQPIDYTLDEKEVLYRRSDWTTELAQQIRDHDAWGILITKSNLDVILFDVFPGSPFAATALGGTAHLLLAKETKINTKENA